MSGGILIHEWTKHLVWSWDDRRKYPLRFSDGDALPLPGGLVASESYSADGVWFLLIQDARHGSYMDWPMVVVTLDTSKEDVIHAVWSLLNEKEHR
jgi:hypothetical protein